MSAPRQSHLALGNVAAGEKPIIFWARNTGFNGSGVNNGHSTAYDYYSKTWTVAKSGTYRFKVMAQGQDANIRVRTQLYKIAAGDDGAGSVVLTTTGGAVSTAVYNQADIAFATGDKFYIRNSFISGQSTGRRFSRLIVSVLQPLTNFCETFEIGNQGSVSANNAYDSRLAFNRINISNMPYRKTTEFGKRNTGRPLCSDPMIQKYYTTSDWLAPGQIF